MERGGYAVLAKPWSAHAFDRALLALMVTAPQIVLLIWLVTNGGGVVEDALWLEPAPLVTRLVGVGIWLGVIGATLLAVSKGGAFIWLWLIAVAAPLYWVAFAPGASDIVSVTPFLPLAGLFVGVGLFTIADWLCALIFLLLQAAFDLLGLRVELIEGDVEDFSKRGRLQNVLMADGAGFGVFVAIVAWSLSLTQPHLIPYGILGVLGVTFAAHLALSLLRRLGLALVVYALLAAAPYVAVLNSSRFGFWPAAPQPVFVHMALIILVAAPVAWVGYALSAHAARVGPRGAPVLGVVAGVGTGAALHFLFATFVAIVPDLAGAVFAEVRMDAAREIWIESAWSWAVAGVAGAVAFAGCWRRTSDTQAAL